MCLPGFGEQWRDNSPSEPAGKTAVLLIKGNFFSCTRSGDILLLFIACELRSCVGLYFDNNVDYFSSSLRRKYRTNAAPSEVNKAGGGGLVI